MEELGTDTWRTSSYSGANGGQCVEIGGHGEGRRVLVRDTKNREGSALAFRPDAWRRFAGQLKAGTLPSLTGWLKPAAGTGVS